MSHALERKHCISRVAFFFFKVISYGVSRVYVCVCVCVCVCVFVRARAQLLTFAHVPYTIRKAGQN